MEEESGIWSSIGGEVWVYITQPKAWATVGSDGSHLKIRQVGTSLSHNYWVRRGGLSSNSHLTALDVMGLSTKESTCGQTT